LVWQPTCSEGDRSWKPGFGEAGKQERPEIRANAQRPHDGQAVALLDPFKTKACRTKISFSLQKRHSSSIERVLKHSMLDLGPGTGCARQAANES